MRSTKTQANLELAAELFNTRLQMRELEKREKELKEYFKNILGQDSSISISNEFTVILSESKRKAYSKDLLDIHFEAKGINPDNFKLETISTILKIAKN